jgi:hypothetical protein
VGCIPGWATRRGDADRCLGTSPSLRMGGHARRDSALSLATGPAPRTIDPEWIDQRDPDGSIRADLERLGLLENGMVSTIDAGQLLALRMEQAGLNVAINEYPGGHQDLGKSEELVAYIEAAVSDWGPSHAAETRSAGYRCDALAPLVLAIATWAYDRSVHHMAVSPRGRGR